MNSIHHHPLFRLGKGKAQNDRRDLRFRAVMLDRAPKVPAAYDFDTPYRDIPLPMFRNDELGDCVIAGRAHQTLRFERREQGRIIPIADADVTHEYFTETGGTDDGLVVADSLALWRRHGWQVGDKFYRILGYARVDHRKPADVRQAVFSHDGIGLGVQLPLAAQVQMQAGRPWSVTTGKGSRVGSWGGHYVYCCGYTPAGPVCVTWGQKQQMTWAWLAKYGDEAFAVFDGKDTPAAVRAFLEKLKP